MPLGTHLCCRCMCVPRGRLKGSKQAQHDVLAMRCDVLVNTTVAVRPNMLCFMGKGEENCARLKQER